MRQLRCGTGSRVWVGCLCVMSSGEIPERGPVGVRAVRERDVLRAVRGRGQLRVLSCRMVFQQRFVGMPGLPHGLCGIFRPRSVCALPSRRVCEHPCCNPVIATPALQSLSQITGSHRKLHPSSPTLRCTSAPKRMLASFETARALCATLRAAILEFCAASAIRRPTCKAEEGNALNA